MCGLSSCVEAEFLCWFGSCVDAVCDSLDCMHLALFALCVCPECVSIVCPSVFIVSLHCERVPLCHGGIDLDKFARARPRTLSLPVPPLLPLSRSLSRSLSLAPSLSLPLLLLLSFPL